MSPTSAPTRLEVADTPGIPLPRLVRVETRKALDTRAGRWLTGLTLGLTLVVVLLVSLLSGDPAPAFGDLLSIAGGVLGFFLPVIGILLITSEWGQRTALVTFTLEPRRTRVVAAKFLAGLVLSAAVLVIALVFAALGTLAAGARDGAWKVDGLFVLNVFVLGNLVALYVGFAIAALLRQTAAAIVVYFLYSFALPGVVAIAGELVSWFRDVGPWIELNTALQPLFTDDYRASGAEWAHIATAGLLWLVLPLVLGTWRLLRAEVT